MNIRSACHLLTAATLCLAVAACSGEVDSATTGGALPNDATSFFQDMSVLDSVADAAAAADAGTPTDAAAEADLAPPVSCPGGSGCPCDDNGDCDNALCIDMRIDLGGGKRCAHTCVDSCPPGLECAQVGGEGGDVVSICVAKDPHLCNPCAASTDCQSLGAGDGLCVDHGPAGSFCGVSCAATAGCPEGYVCADVTSVEEGQAKQCVPVALDDGAAYGVCSCSAAAVAAKLETTCWIVHKDKSGAAISECAGVATCAAAGPIACTAPDPEAEICDGADNDCDGDVDEDTCDDGQICTTDSCGGAQGCSNVALSDGLACDADGNVCTDGDACQGGKCTPGPLKNCDDGNPCTKDACGMATGCTQVHDDGAPCSDDNPCTLGDVCQSGQCDAGVTKGCVSGKPCVLGECSLQTGACVFFNQQEGKVCDDGDACTVKDACSGGLCLGVVSSCDDGNVCTNDACDPAVGCKSEAAPGVCSDGNPCTLGDLCVLGACKAGLIKDCNDSNGCTVDSCNLQSGDCDNVGLPKEGTPCDADGTVCTQGDACKSGICTQGPALKCDDANPCTADTCHPAQGCQSVPTTGLCDADGTLCTKLDTCVDGQCKAGNVTDCNDNNPCTLDGCEPSTGLCSHDPKPAQGDACDADGSACTVSDACDGGKCTPGKTTVCTDGNACTVDSCVAATGKCQFDSQALEGQGCDADGDGCTVGDVCTGGFCVAGAKAICAQPAEQCQQAACVNKGKHAYQCVAIPKADVTPCSDGSACTLADFCKGGKCLAGAQKSCPDNGFCLVGSCDSKNGQCGTKPGNEGQGCSDGSECTTNDGCKAGTCVGTALQCKDGNVCTDDLCNKNSGCLFAANTASCDDSDACTKSDVCADKTCKGKAIVCKDGNVCTEDFCSKQTGCLHPPNNALCPDANPCTTSEVCSSGTCKTKPTNCNDNNVCTIDTCKTVGGCQHGAVANNTSCGSNQWCQSGKCVVKNLPCTVTWNPNDKGAGIVMSNGNKTISTSAIWPAARATLGHSTGKWYFEVLAVVNSNGFNFVGIGRKAANLNSCCTGNKDSWGYYGREGHLRGPSGNLDVATHYVNGSFSVGVAVDLNLDRIWWSLNGVWQYGGNPAAGFKPTFSDVSGTVYPQSSIALTGATSTIRACASELKYPPPSGFKAWGG